MNLLEGLSETEQEVFETQNKRLRTKKWRAFLIKRLIEIRKQMHVFPAQEAGICKRLEMKLSCKEWEKQRRFISAYCIIPLLAIGYPRHSGDLMYPIGAGDGWLGIVGKERFALLDYIINKLENWDENN